ncbi:MAG: PstS family phosphate ABC transporter substrate-binding protein [Vicinamibacterales bacterium]|nr:PstS family phosphate ABC transporter substrate-binding protein [Vicinamibacterales bacterium]
MAAVLAACGGPQGPSGSGSALVRLDGSSTVFPISEAVAEEFRLATGTNVTVGISGTGGGFQKFCRGETDISNASRPISEVEIEACRKSGIGFIELPMAYDGIAIVVNPKASWIESITVAELKRLWEPGAQGTVRRWNQVRASWPDREIHLFGAGVDSGTYDYFTQAITGKEGASRGDFTASEDDNVLVQGIRNDELALGFLPFAYYHENRDSLKLIPVDDEQDLPVAGPVAPNMDTIRSGDYQPLSRPVFIYVSEPALARPEVQAFMDFYVANAGELAAEVGYVDLGTEGYRLVGEHLASRRLGSAFEHGGSQVGLTLEQLLSRERLPQ